MKQTKMIKCPRCGAEYPEGSTKFCAACGWQLPKKKKWWLIPVIVVLAIAFIGSIGGSDDTDENASSSGDITNSNTQAGTNTEEPVIEEEPEVVIEYTPCTVGEMVNELNDNALRAETKYDDQYMEITGRLDVIDSDGKYISIYPIDDEWAFMGVQCFIENDEQLDKVLEMNVGDIVVVRGKITAVGEVLGYQLDIDEIVS